jgi:molybdopterin converting factor small subunit
MEIEINLPSLLRDSAGGEHRLMIAGATLAEALHNLLDHHPRLRAHLYDDEGRQRQHVTFYYNGESVSSLPSFHEPLRRGDQLEIIQAVSGG